MTAEKENGARGETQAAIDSASQFVTDWESLNAQEQAQAFDREVQAGRAVEMISALANRYWQERKKVVLPLVQAQSIQPQKQSIQNIGMFYHSLNKGGTENVMAVLADELSDLGYKLVLFTDAEPHPDDYRMRHNPPRVVLPLPNEGRDSLARARCLDQALREYQIDCFIWHAWVDEKTLWDMLVIKAAKIPFISYVHSFFDLPKMTPDWPYQYDMPAVYALIDAVVVLSRVDRMYWQAFSDKVYRMPQPLRTDLLRNNNPSPAAPTELVWVGRLSWEKGYQSLLDIMEKLLPKVPKAHLTVVGGGEMPDVDKEFAEAIKARGLSQAITPVGYQADPTEYYEKASIYLLTSMVEGFALTIWEAKSHGLPCVMYDLPYLESVRDGRGICTVSYADAAAFAQVLSELILDEQRCARLGADARASLDECLDRQDVQTAWQALLAELSGSSTEQSSKWLEAQSDPDRRETYHILWQSDRHFSQMGLNHYLQWKETEHIRTSDELQRLKSRMAETDDLIAARQAQIHQEYEDSLSYRLGRALTWLPRKLLRK